MNITWTLTHRIAKWRYGSPSMGHTAPCRVGCRGEHSGRESAESCSGAPAPPRPARSALHRHLRTPRRLSPRCPSLCAFNATPPSTCRARKGTHRDVIMGNSINEPFPHESAMHCTSGHHDCASEIPRELFTPSSRLRGQATRAPCTTGICLAIRFGARESMEGARGPKVHVALAPPSGAWVMSKDMPPRLLVPVQRLLDLYGAGSVGRELSPGGACRGKQTFTEKKKTRETF